jgi:hypothetical protein
MSPSAPWPPPPDLKSIKQLVREADVEDFIADGSPPDEYDAEAESLHAAIAHIPTDEIIVNKLLPILEAIWSKHLIDEAELMYRRPALEKLAEQIARFFGPEAKPQVREKSL